MFAIIAILKLFLVVVGNSLRLRPASYAELGKNASGGDKCVHGRGLKILTLSSGKLPAPDTVG